MGKDKTKDGDAATSTETNRDHSQDQEARDAAPAKTITKAVARETQTIAEVFAREMAKAHAQYQATIKENRATTLPSTLPSTLKVTSGSNGFRIMDPFDWTRDKTIYQRWQLWPHKARLTLDAMEGDSENTKISYFHHWINGEGISKIEGWKNNKIHISQSDYDALEDRQVLFRKNRVTVSCLNFP